MYRGEEHQACVEPQACGTLEEPADHILIIDDDVALVDVLAYRFIKQGYRVSMANTSADGIVAAKRDAPDVVLLDIGLPDGSGLDVCSRLCDDPQTADIPVLLVSGFDDRDVVKRARAAGCRYYVRKPYDPNALLVLTENAIAESRAW